MVVLFFLVYGMLAGGLWLIQLRFGTEAAAGLADSEEFKKLHTMVLAGMATVYAVYRLWRFHPMCNRGYAAWLEFNFKLTNQRANTEPALGFSA